MFTFHTQHNQCDLRNTYFSTSRCNSFDIDKYYLSRCLCRYQNIYNVYMCVQIRIFMPKSEIRVKFGIYNSDMWRFGAISHACFKHGGCPDLTSRGDGSLAAASFFMIFIGQNDILSVPCSLKTVFMNYFCKYICKWDICICMNIV